MQALTSGRNENAAGPSISDSGVWILDAKIGFGLQTVEFSTTQRHGKLEKVLSARTGRAVGTHTVTRRSALLSSKAVADRSRRFGVDARDQQLAQRMDVATKHRQGYVTFEAVFLFVSATD